MLDLNRRQLLALLASLALAPACADDATPASPDVHADTPGGSRFKHIYADPALRDAFLLFLTHVFHLVPEHALHHEIAQACAELETDREIYARIRERFGDIAPLLSSVRFALPAHANASVTSRRCCRACASPCPRSPNKSK